MWLTQEDARADVQQLANLLIESHPDPYSGVGGPIAFHRQAQDILTALPAEGMSSGQLLRLLRPFVASLRDGHTNLFDADETPAHAPTGPRLWLDWDVVEEQLYVGAVYRAEETRLLGARLAAVEDAPFPLLVERIEQIRAADNIYANLTHLADALADPVLLPELLATRGALSRLGLDLILADGGRCALELPLQEAAPGDRIEPPSAIELPEPNAADMCWSFLDGGGAVAWLRIGVLTRYRERFEHSRAIGDAGALGADLADAAGRATRGPMPADLDARIAAVPSATDLFGDLFAAMREAQTADLIVDLRRSPGGNSFASSILEYFLYGAEGMLAVEGGYQIRRYSPLYRANYRSPPAETVERIETCAGNGGYDFSEEEAWRRRRGAGMTAAQRERRADEFDRHASRAPGFARVFELARSTPAWSPRVTVLTSAWTYSAGFDIAAMLVKHGATLVGVPSAQAGNCFIDCLRYTLNRSGLRGFISYKASLLFPDEPERGNLLRPDVELTYARLAELDFDPNASIRLARDHLRSLPIRSGEA